MTPDDLNIRLQHFRVNEFMEFIDRNEFKDCKWDDVFQSLFIESLMIFFPIPIFYLDGSKKGWKIIDGRQRIYAIDNFINHGFKLRNLEFLPECNNKYFNELEGYLRARITNAELKAYVINPGTPDDVKSNIFNRIRMQIKNICGIT